MAKTDDMTEQFENALVVKDFGGELTNPTSFYSSMKPSNEKEQALLFNAMTAPTGRLSDLINNEIIVKDIFCEGVTMSQVDDTTGEIVSQTVPRIVLIDIKGNSYQCVSSGIFNALQKLISLYGEPTWENGIKLKVKQITKGSGKEVRQILTLQM